MAGASYPGSNPLTVGAVLGSAFELYRRHVTAVWAIVALIAIPAQLLVWIMVRVSVTHASARNGVIYSQSSAALPSVAIALLGFLSAILTMGALSRLLAEAYTGHQTSWQQSLGDASTQLGRLFLLAIVAFIFLVIGYSLFIIPGLFLTVTWCAAAPALMFERLGPLRALGRSAELVRGYWWNTFASLIVALAIIVGISVLVDELLARTASSSSVDVVLTLAGISRAVAAILTYPFLAAVVVVIYANLRGRKEGVAPENLVPAAM